MSDRYGEPGMADRDTLDPKWVGHEWIKYMRAQLAGEAAPLPSQAGVDPEERF